MLDPFGRTRYTRKSISQPKRIKQSSSLKNNLIRTWIILLFFVFSYSFGRLSSLTKSVVGIGSYLLWNTIGKDMNTDKSQNINILLVGYGWHDHDGWQLADTIMVASYDTDLHSVSLLSLPRDLLVITHEDKIGRINSVMSRAYNSNGQNIQAAAVTLSQKVEKITGLTIPYYAMIDFDGFVKIVDSLWGIDINVPQHFLDMQYPVDWNGEYEIFELPEGMNKLSGPNTLKYARSRHSTSDFSRSKRQQSIIKAIMSKIMSSENFSISKFKELYTNYTSIVKTNISLDHMIWLLQYDTAMPTMHSFGYTMQCSNDIRKTMIPWCVLRPANGGILPSQTTWWNIELYDDMKFFADLVLYHQDYLNEETPITVYNASDKTISDTLPHGDRIALKTAVKLNRYAFNVVQVTNAPSISSGTFVEIYGTGKYDNTLDMLKKFITIDDVKIMSWSFDQLWNYMTGGLYIYLGNNYLNAVGNTEFDYY